MKYTVGLHSFICLRKFASHKTDTSIFFLYYPLSTVTKKALNKWKNQWEWLKIEKEKLEGAFRGTMADYICSYSYFVVSLQIESFICITYNFVSNE